MSRTLFRILFFAALLPLAAQAKTVELNIDKEAKYDKRVASLKEGDTVVFENGEHFKLGKYLGGGMENMIFALDKDHVIRIPNRAMASLSARSTVDGAEPLIAMGVPTVRVEGAPIPKGVADAEMEYAIAERIKPRFTLEEFLKGQGAAAKLSKAEEKAAADAFVEFARKTALFQNIGDAGPNQIVLTADGEAKLMDWGGNHQLIDPAKIKSEKALLKLKNNFSLMMEKAPGNLTDWQRRANRLAGYDEWDIGQNYLSLNESQRWLAIKDRIQKAIDDARHDIWKKYDGDLETALKKIGKKNLATYEPLNFGKGATMSCLRSLNEILKFAIEGDYR